jgi:ethanolamine permease
MEGEGQLQRTLGPVTIWALGVGYVISGMYFGWNLGLPHGGPYGLLLATLVVTVMYVTFVLGYAELAGAMPRAGGAFVYAQAAFGPGVGFLAGVAQCIEFVFAPPAIAAAIGAYLAIFIEADPLAIAAAAYVLFTALNVWGVKQSAWFEVVITVLAVGELLIFAGVTAPQFTWAAFSRDPLPNGWAGALPAIPFAIWFYLAIEGIANVAEEARDPKRDLTRGFGLAMGTLVVLALLTFFTAVGVDGWRTIVYAPGSTVASDSPLPLALGKVVGQSHVLYHLLIGIGLCGLLASFHGIILVAGRATFELGRAGMAPWLLGLTSRRTRTPVWALVTNMFVGLLALTTGATGAIISVAVLGALTLYVISMAALFRLRVTHPDLPRPFVTPLYPWVPGLALVLSILCLGATLWYGEARVAIAYGALLASATVYYVLVIPREATMVAKLKHTPP